MADTYYLELQAEKAKDKIDEVISDLIAEVDAAQQSASDWESKCDDQVDEISELKDRILDLEDAISNNEEEISNLKKQVRLLERIRKYENPDGDD